MRYDSMLRARQPGAGRFIMVQDLDETAPDNPHLVVKRMSVSRELTSPREESRHGTEEDKMAGKTSARILFAVIFMGFVFVAGCGGRGGMGAPDEDLGFVYDMADEGILKYRTSTKSVQEMSIHGMEMEVNSDKLIVFAVDAGEEAAKSYARPGAMADRTVPISVTIDSLKLATVSPQGTTTADPSSVIGKSFHMTLSPKGEELDFSGAGEMVYEMGAVGERNLSADFQAFFPDLPGGKIAVGETWTSRDTLRVDEGDGEIRIVLEALNTLEGYEKVMGLECARISAVVTGTLSGEGEQRGSRLTFDGTLTGTELWHFAHEEGIFVKSVSESDVSNTITVEGPQSMEIPVVQTIKMMTTLIR